MHFCLFNVTVVEPHLSSVGRVQACDSGSVPAGKPQRLRDIQEQLLKGHHTPTVQQDCYLVKQRDNNESYVIQVDNFMEY